MNCHKLLYWFTIKLTNFNQSTCYSGGRLYESGVFTDASHFPNWENKIATLHLTSIMPTNSVATRQYYKKILVIRNMAFLRKNKSFKWNKISHKNICDMPQCRQTGLPRGWQKKIPWLFPNCQHKFQSLLRYIPGGDFLQYIQNHIEITLLINTCFNIVVLKIGQPKRMFPTSWKLSYRV